MNKRLADSLKQDAVNRLRLPTDTNCKPDCNEKNGNSPFQVDFLTHKIVNIE